MHLSIRQVVSCLTSARTDFQNISDFPQWDVMESYQGYKPFAQRGRISNCMQLQTCHTNAMLCYRKSRLSFFLPIWASWDLHMITILSKSTNSSSIFQAPSKLPPISIHSTSPSLTELSSFLRSVSVNRCHTFTGSTFQKDQHVQR